MLYIGDKPYLLDDKIFEVWYNEWRDELMEIAPNPDHAGDVSVLIKIMMLDELKALREYVKREDEDFPYGTTK